MYYSARYYLLNFITIFVLVISAELIVGRHYNQMYQDLIALGQLSPSAGDPTLDIEGALSDVFSFNRVGDDNDETFTGYNFDKLPWQDSVMFNKTRVDQLYKTMSNYRQQPGQIDDQRTAELYSVDAEGNLLDSTGNIIGYITPDMQVFDLDNKLIGRVDESGIIYDLDGFQIGLDSRLQIADAPAEELPQVAPAFYLNSVLFYEDANWTIWLNNRRIRHGRRLNTLNVVRVEEDFVDLLWEPKDLDFMSPGWREKVIPISYSNISTELGVPLSEEQITELTDPALRGMTAEERRLLAGLQETEEGDNASGGIDISASSITIFEEDITLLRNALNKTLSEGEETEFAGLEGAPEGEEDIAELAELELPLLEEEVPAIELDSSELTSQLEQVIEEERIALEAEKAEEGESIDFTESEEEFDPDAYDWAYKSADGNILVDNIAKNVLFRVGLNQTFVSHTLEVAEGFVMSTQLVVPENGGGVPGQQPDELEQIVFDFEN